MKIYLIALFVFVVFAPMEYNHLSKTSSAPALAKIAFSVLFGLLISGAVVWIAHIAE